MEGDKNRIRLGVVLSAGGLRGAAHLGVLRQLLRHGIWPDILAGVSAGAIIAAYYAAVGMTIDEMIHEARTFLGRHLLIHCLALRSPRRLRALLGKFSGTIPRRLLQLEEASFEKLHHGVQGLGIVCHDLVSRRTVYFATGTDDRASLAEAVKASAAIPGLMPSLLVGPLGAELRLVDGGISDSLPVNFALSPGLGATHLIVSDCRRVATGAPSSGNGDTIAYIRPDIQGTGVLRSPRAGLLAAVEQGEAAVTNAIVQRIKSWRPTDSRWR